MKKGSLFKRSVTALLSVALLLGTIGTDVLAASANPATNNRASYDTDMDTEISAVNTVGNLIKNTLDANTENEESEEGYDIIGLSIEGKLATVEYDTLEDSEIVVAIYAEGQEPLQMLASGKADAIKDEHIVQVTIESDSIPDYFIAKAFLLRKASHSPLCNAYTSNLYTRELQELQEKTIADFNEKRILNLDEDETTNYAVYSADTEIIDEQSGKNKVKDNGNGIYTVTNADVSFTGLKKGDVFSYNYDDGTVLVVKIASIQIDGTTVVITEDKEAELSDAFDYVKIEGSDDGANVTVDDSSLEEGVTYEGEEAVNRSRAIDIGGSISKKFNLNFSHKVTQGNGAVEITGGIELGIKTDINLYISLSYQHIEIKQEFPISISAELSGSLEKKFKLVSFTVSPVAGLYIRFTPSVVLRASGKLKYEIGFTTVIGFSYDNKKGLVSKCSSPRITKSKLSAKISLYVGLSLSPDITIISESIAKTDLSADIGIEAALQKNLSEYDSSKIHRCKNCIEGELLAKVKISVNANLANLKVSAILYKTSNKISDFYYSADQNDFGFTKCPYYNYKVTLKARDSQKNPIANAVVSDSRLQEYGTTNTNGEIIFFLPKGSYHLTVSNKSYSGSTDVNIEKSAKTINVEMIKEEPTTGTIGENLTWNLDKNNTLIISGSGEMDSYYDSGLSERPWNSFKNKITAVVIEKGVTKIGSNAFRDCVNLSSISIPDSVTDIYGRAFQDCTTLKNIILPNTIHYIGDSLFEGCTNLNNVTLPNTIHYIGDSLFEGCTNLNSVTLPNTTTIIKPYMFYNCTSLRNITIPDSVTYIDKLAFGKCSSLKGIIIPDNVNYIGDAAFQNCSALNNIVIPEGITEITADAFYGCTNLNSIVLPSTLININISAFGECSSLNNITIPEGVTSIGEWGIFQNCTNLSSIVLPSTLTSINMDAFIGCDNLHNITIPPKVTIIQGYSAPHFWEVRFLGDAPEIIDGLCGNICDKIYYPSGNSSWTEDILESLSFLGGDTIWIPYDFNTETPVYPMTEETTQQNNGINNNNSIQENNVSETITSIPVKLYTAIKSPVPKTVVYSVEIDGIHTASTQELVPQSEYLLAVVNDETADDLLAPANLLYIDQKASDTSGFISLSYIPKDDSSGAELFFGAGEVQKLDEFIAKILAAQPDDIVQAEEGSFSTIPAAALNAASKQQVYLELSTGNNIYWQIDGKSVPTGTVQDMDLGVIRTDKENGKIPADTISEIIGKYDAEQINLPESSPLPGINTSLRIGTDASLNSWKCVIFQYDTTGEIIVTDNTLIQNSETYINSIQEENYLLVYGKNGDVSGDKKVNMTDLMKILYHISGRTGLDTLEQSIADINLDKNINMTDLMKVLYYVSGRNTDL